MKSESPACLELRAKVPSSWGVESLDAVTDFQEGPGILAKDFKELTERRTISGEVRYYDALTRKRISYQKHFEQLDELNSLGFESITVVDVHSEVSPAAIPNIENISVLPELTKLALEEVNADDCVKSYVISPDAGASKRTFDTAKNVPGYDIEIVECAKHRDLATGKLVTPNSIAAAITTMFAKVPKPGRSPRGNHERRIIAEIKKVDQPIFIFNLKDRPCESTDQGAFPVCD